MAAGQFVMNRYLVLFGKLNCFLFLFLFTFLH